MAAWRVFDDYCLFVAFQKVRRGRTMPRMTTTTLQAPAAIAAPFKQDATVIGLVGLAHASSHFGHLLLPLLFPVFMQEFGLSYSQLGLLMTVFFVVSGVGQACARLCGGPAGCAAFACLGGIGPVCCAPARRLPW